MGTTLFVDPTGTLAITGAGASLISTVYRAYRSNQDYTDALSKPMAYATAFKMRN